MSASEAYLRIEKIIAKMKEADRNRQYAVLDNPSMVSHYTDIYLENLHESVADSKKYGLENLVSEIGGLNVILNKMEDNMYAKHEAISKVAEDQLNDAIISAKIASHVYHTTYDTVLNHLKEIQRRINLCG